MSKTKQRLRSIYHALRNGAQPQMRDLVDRAGASRAAIFNEFYKENLWEGSVSRSGPGSTLEQTEAVRKELPLLLQEFGIRSMLDAPCGDFYWMNATQIEIDSYVGGDIVKQLIEANQQQFENAKRRFVCLDITRDRFDKVDLVLCRDCLVHFSYHDIQRVIRNFKNSDSSYLLTTTFTRLEANSDIPTGQWRPVNLQRPPFNFPAPLRVINERCTENDGQYADKSLGLWDLRNLPDFEY